MPYLTKYHVGEQEAYALLGPVCAALRELERRTAHYAGRLAMEPADVAAVQAARRVLEGARQEVERIWQGSAPGPEGAGATGAGATGAGATGAGATGASAESGR
jgi:hypothetical protein